jgi:mono/diheme cytochrome c family protein
MVRTRSGVALVTLAVLLAIDAGRSINARVAYSRPAEVWQPDPAEAADLTWPPGTDVSEEADPGQRVFGRWCATCHGPDGRGNGPAAPSMIPRPRDFTTGLFKYKSTPPHQPPTDDDLYRTIADGLQASAMPYFRDLLNDDEIRAVVSHIKTLAPVAFADTAPVPLTVPPRPPIHPAAIERGRAAYMRLGCGGCHDTKNIASRVLQDSKGHQVRVRDLKAPWTFHGGSGPAQVWLRITTGLAGSSMPSYLHAATDAERWDVVSYLESQSRTAPWDAGGSLAGPGQDPDPARRGEYLVHAQMCGLCHTQINRTGIYRDQYYLAGGMRVGAYPHGFFVSRNLTSDAASGLGGWSDEELTTVFRTGWARNRMLSLWGMPWFLLHALHKEDATAIARYLRTQLPAKRNWIPEPLHYGVVETVVMKLMRPLPAARPRVLTYADGNFGRSSGDGRQPLAQRILIGAQWIVLAAGVAVYVLTPARASRPSGVPRIVRTVLSAAAVVVLGVVLWALYGLPALRVIPPEQIVAGAAGNLVRPNLAAIATVEQRTLVERGRYLYAIQSCVLCHRPDGQGGSKINWQPMGTLWTRNITPDPETGIGRWNEREIARAIRSGITPDGRVLHWQGMIWDHASNLDEEDVRSIVTFLRAMPPVRHAVPSARPPAPDDCETYTFWIDESTVPGCR